MERLTEIAGNIFKLADELAESLDLTGDEKEMEKE